MCELLLPISGNTIPRMVGRGKLLQRIWSDLTRVTASNLSIVGPRLIGKTVLMRALADRAETAKDSPYSLVVHWHLGHVCPASDAEFIGELCQQTSDVMGRRSGKDFADYRQYLADKTYSKLKEATEMLDSEGVRILMIWDGFDKPLGQGRLSGHLWDQIREIFYGRNHKIVTATRAPLDQLIRSEDAITSPFWNIFDQPPIRIEPFDAADLSLACERTELNLTQGGRTELANWTAGHPLLLCAVLQQLTKADPAGEKDNARVAEAARIAAEETRTWLDALWDDCYSDAKEVFRLLLERGELLASEIGRDESDCLTVRGFAIRAGNKLKPGCRMMQKHVRGILPDVGSLKRMFGVWDNYRSHIRNVLELRLLQIPVVNNRLHRLVARAIEDIPEYPDDCLNNLTSIEEVTLNLIWEHESGAAKTIPAEVIAYWTAAPRNQDNLVKGMMEADDWRILPEDRLRQVRLLQLLTGSKAGFESRAKRVSKDTYVLLNAIHSFRNRSEHSSGQPTHQGVAVAALFICLELLSCLARDLE